MAKWRFFVSYGSGVSVSDGTAAGTSQIVGAASPAQHDFTSIDGNTELLYTGLLGNTGFGLWVSNGTAGGTFEIGGANDASVTGAASTGLDPLQIIGFGSKALFRGYDSTGTIGLWVTDGTAAGTFELGGLKNAGLGTTNFAGLSAAHFTAFGNKVLFDANDSDSFEGVWVSDGTTAGTFEIGGLKNAGVSGAASQPILGSISLGSRVLYGQIDSSGAYGLWVTDGTAAGTAEIGGLGSSGIPGILAGDFSLSFNSQNGTVGSRALFEAPDSTAFPGLWVSDGTVAGTYEVGGLGGAGFATASLTNFSPNDVTAFGSKALFQAHDTNNNIGLWITDGTTAGTSNIGGLNSAGITNAGQNFDPTDFTVIGNKVLFDATDASGQTTLWVTDGTAAGTVEIGGLNNKGVSGAAPGGIAGIGTTINLRTSFTANGNYATFAALDSANQYGLWVSDGTVAGTHELSGYVSTNGTFDLADLAPHLADQTASSDFTGGITSGALLQSGGNLIDWSLSNGAYSGYVSIGGASGYGVIGTGDVDGGGTTDILLQNGGGSIIDWIVNNGAYAGYNAIGNANVSGYGVVGTGDFNGDGTSDILLENGAGGLIDWLIKNGVYSGYAAIGNTSGYGVVGTGDFNGDGTNDVLLQNNGGSIIDWTVSNGQYSGYGSIGNANVSGYGVVGTGDFNGDGTTDILLENGSGNLIDWTLQNGAYAGYNEIGGTSGYGIVGTGDYNGDGTSDILLQNGSGNVIDWIVKNGQFSGWNEVGGASPYAVVHK
jgi:ELWxxDGT repeat protein